ncbi:hypothetical protein GA0061098_10902 [Bradyrhizobium shewense]|uniref:Uncharacterized protein n=1 Tax=Bradyrhizobium shewense TaxID=1761772 RepID=A0A1C3XVA5_9BRAD|nr:hypothetical protein GA0061098_10902 [Bradyrhizobium shewense]
MAVGLVSNRNRVGTDAAAHPSAPCPSRHDLPNGLSYYLQPVIDHLTSAGRKRSVALIL